MTDDLDPLKSALQSLPPADPTAKADAITLAMKNFDALQGSTQPLRPNQDRHTQAGFLNGVRKMLTSLTSRGFLAATTSAAALCLGLIVVLPTLDQPDIAALPIALPKEDDARTRENTSNAAAPNVESRQQPQTVEPAGQVAKSAAPFDGVVPLQDVPEQSAAEGTAADRALSGDAEMGIAAPLAPAPLAESYATALAQPELEMGRVGSTLADKENTEAFPDAPQNPLKVTAEAQVSTFSIDVDTASYAVVRSSLMNGLLPPPEAVRIEEMVNYFPYSYAAPDTADAPFRSSVTVMQTPWNPGTRLVHIGLQGRLPALADRPALNLVFLIDTSGSMDEPNKLPLLKQSLKLMLAELRPADQVAMVAYAGSAGTVLEPTKASETATILAALDNLAAGGSTAGAEGLALAYDVAEAMGADGEVSRILLATDGDFNVGVDDPAGLEAYIAKKRDTGIYLSVLGFGRGNLDDATMQALAQNGNGTAAYIDTLNEARKVLVDQLTGALFPIANDVKIQVEWNPAAVAEYRLIGYETRALNREDFNNDKVDAGEIGAGHSVTAIYEVTAPGSAALRNDPLRYGDDLATGDLAELGFLRLRYKAPGEATSALIETPITPGGEAGDDARFAVAIAGFGQMLTSPLYLNDWGWDEAISMALAARGDDPFGYRIEAVNLMRMAQALDNE